MERRGGIPEEGEGDVKGKERVEGQEERWVERRKKCRVEKSNKEEESQRKEERVTWGRRETNKG